MKEIEIEFPNLRISIAKEGMDFNSFEEIVFETSMELGRRVLIKAMEKMDDVLREERPDGLDNLGKRKKYIATRLGDIRYLRRLYRDSEGGCHYLLDERLRLKKNQRVSASRGKIESFLAFVGNSYREAERFCEMLLGGSRSFEAIRRKVIVEGGKIKNAEDAELKMSKDPNVSIGQDALRRDAVYVEVDGTGIGLRQKKKKGRKGSEIKLGIVHTGWENRYKNGQGKAKRLKDKFVYGGIENSETFMEKLSILAEKHSGLSRAKNVVVGGDGARWIKEGICSYFPGAIYQLCRFHLDRFIKTALSYNRELSRAVKSLVLKERIDEVINILKREIKDGNGDREELNKLGGYIISNADGINGIEKLKERGIRAAVRRTGAIEGNIDKVIANRFKKRGRVWSIKGAEGLLKLGLKILNGQWDSWWEEEREEKFEIRKEEIKRLIPDNLMEKRRNKGMTIEVGLPALYGPDQDRPWVRVLRELTSRIGLTGQTDEEFWH